ncbi:hypothetical protein NPIL_154161 [Nephila pilipes]|uniref:Uncharacterized protein n=1 Tax=Nephila pilipes TaxID=299642 RepID=A0A8X6IZF2_NEPPI|nr:hypothetical protein NPIL_154161 [Nephila pilipes]
MKLQSNRPSCALKFTLFRNLQSLEYSPSQTSWTHGLQRPKNRAFFRHESTLNSLEKCICSCGTSKLSRPRITGIGSDAPFIVQIQSGSRPWYNWCNIITRGTCSG